jgi:hypothetical protein
MKPDPALQVQPPSRAKIAKAAAISLVAAAAILVIVVLPAEYGIDPLGTGAALGLTQMSAATLPVEDPVITTVGAALAPIQEGPIGNYPAEYKFDKVEFVLGPYEYIEYKYRLDTGATMLYSWAASSSVIHDFHGERDGGDPNDAQSFDKQDRRQAYGTFSAPFTGIHGWYWENPRGEPVTVKLTTSGYYSAAVEIRSNRTRRPHELISLENITVSKASHAPAGSP